MGASGLLDLNLRRDCWTPESVRSSIERADVLKLNDDEAAVVAPFYGLADVPLREFPVALLAGTRLSHVVVTLGSRGAFAVARTGESVYEPAHAVEVIDTVGSGDAFSAGFAHGLLAGWPLARCLAVRQRARSPRGRAARGHRRGDARGRRSPAAGGPTTGFGPTVRVMR